ncbi:MAG: PQQ-binding-like beta-propeller repeat protein [Acidobacteriota bacterium]|nr:PQQ-binding-like beta-propeller repeat protein [Acidobacteriota bacterium]
MRRKLAPVAVLILLSGVSCAMIRPRPAPYPEGLVFPLVVAEQMDMEGTPSSLAAGDDGTILAALRDGRILAVRSEKDGVLWAYEAGHPLSDTLAVSSGRIFAVDENGVVHVLDEDGALIWKTSIEGQVSTDAVLFKDKICLGTEEGRIFALETAGEGRVAWIYEAGNPVVSGPEVFEDGLFFMTEDGRIHALNPSGRLLWSTDAGGRSSGPLLIRETMAYYGTEDRHIRGFDLERRRLRWSMRVGGHVAARPKIRGNTLYVLTTEGVLYGMMAHRGDILWWRALPSRSVLGLALAGDNVYVSCRSPLLTAFNARTGEKAGEFALADELVSEALWLDPRIVVPIQGPDEAGRLVFLERDIRLSLTANKTSPQEPGQEITFTASAVGFHRPQYTFFLTSGNEARRIVQAESERNTLAWFPDREGAYAIEVSVRDERMSLEAKADFEVKRAAEKPKEPKEKKEKRP